jgi:hypothetical protein
LLTEIRRPRPGIDVVETTRADELEAFFRTLPAQADGGPVVVLAGGDGSHMAGVSALARVFGDRLPPVALAPGGTVGTVARNWGAGGNPVRRVRDLLDGLSRGALPTVARPTLQVSEEGGQASVGFIFGAGLVARFFERYERAGASGNLAAAKIVARVFAGSFVGSSYADSVLAPGKCSISVSGRPAPFDRLSLLCASVVPNLGLGMRLTFRAGRELHRFHAVATPLGPRALGPQMPLVLAGKPLLGPRVDELTERLDLEFPQGEGAYVLDGDLFHADRITVKAGPVIDVLV